jgi:hypothetical protein
VWDNGRSPIAVAWKGPRPQPSSTDHRGATQREATTAATRSSAIPTSPLPGWPTYLNLVLPELARPDPNSSPQPALPIAETSSAGSCVISRRRRAVTWRPAPLSASGSCDVPKRQGRKPGSSRLICGRRQKGPLERGGVEPGCDSARALWARPGWQVSRTGCAPSFASPVPSLGDPPSREQSGWGTWDGALKASWAGGCRPALRLHLGKSSCFSSGAAGATFCCLAASGPCRFPGAVLGKMLLVLHWLWRKLSGFWGRLHRPGFEWVCHALWVWARLCSSLHLNSPTCDLWYQSPLHFEGKKKKSSPDLDSSMVAQEGKKMRSASKFVQVPPT